MPIYEYRCEQCTHEFEALVMRRDETVQCPQCHGEHLKKLMSAHAVGSGAPDTACGAAPCSPEPMCGAGACPACH